METHAIPIHSKYPGKCILFGEHAVVYGYPAIAMAVDIFSQCTIENALDNQNHLILKNYSINFPFSTIEELDSRLPENFKQFTYGFSKLLEIADNTLSNLNKKGYFRIILESELWQGSGLGSSASTALAFIHSLMKLLAINLDNDNINTIAFAMEKYAHKNPSGIDNTICLEGGMLRYEKGKVTPLILDATLNFLVIFTGKTHNTSQAVQNVKRQMEEDRNRVMRIYEDIGDITNTAYNLIQNKDSNLITKIGKLMNENHNLLKKLHVSNESIESIIEIVREQEIKGVKITGAGLGGSLLCLADVDKLKKLKNNLALKGITSRIVTIYKFE